MNLPNSMTLMKCLTRMDLFNFIELDELYECSECDGSNEIKTFPLGGKEKSTQLNELHEVKWFDEFNEVSVCFFCWGWG